MPGSKLQVLQQLAESELLLFTRDRGRGWPSNTAGSGLGHWYLPAAKALSVGLSNAHFKSLGLPTLIDGTSVTDSNCRVRTRTHGGVAGVGG
jgi:hypothetical protein